MGRNKHSRAKQTDFGGLPLKVQEVAQLVQLARESLVECKKLRSLEISNELHQLGYVSMQEDADGETWYSLSALGTAWIVVSGIDALLKYDLEPS